MRGDNKFVSVQLSNQKVKRMPKGQAEKLVNSGKASYISKSKWRELRTDETSSHSKTT